MADGFSHVFGYARSDTRVECSTNSFLGLLSAAGSEEASKAERNNIYRT